MKTYCIRFPGDFYPYTVHAENERDARSQARDTLSTKWTKCKRLPASTEVWEFTPEGQRQVLENMKRMSVDYARAGQIYEP